MDPLLAAKVGIAAALIIVAASRLCWDKFTMTAAPPPLQNGPKWKVVAAYASVLGTVIALLSWITPWLTSLLLTNNTVQQKVATVGRHEIQINRLEENQQTMSGDVRALCFAVQHQAPQVKIDCQSLARLTY